MLKITKGLIPEGISIYTDDGGRKYMRVRADGEYFCIASSDYIKDCSEWLNWEDAMKSLEADEMTLPTLKQVEMYYDYIDEINDKLKEIDGDLLKDTWYWTSTEYDADRACVYYGPYGGLDNTRKKSCTLLVRPILNLTDK